MAPRWHVSNLTLCCVSIWHASKPHIKWLVVLPKALQVFMSSPTYKQITLDPRSSPNCNMATNNSTWHSIGNFSLHAIFLTHIRQTHALNIKSSQCVPWMSHNTLSSHALHSVTPCHYIHTTRYQLHEFTQHLRLPNDMIRIEPHAVSAYDMHSHEMTHCTTHTTSYSSRLPQIPSKALQVFTSSQTFLHATYDSLSSHDA